MIATQETRFDAKGIILIIILAVLLGLGLSDAEAKSKSRSSKSRSVSTPKTKKVVVKRTVVKKVVKKSPTVTTGNTISLSKKPTIPVQNKKVVVKKTTKVTTVTKHHVSVPSKYVGKKQIRRMKPGMYERNGMICKKNKYGYDKCKSKWAYYYDDVLDADDWFEDDDDYQQQVQYNNNIHRNIYQERVDTHVFTVWLKFMGIVFLIVILFIGFATIRK